MSRVNTGLLSHPYGRPRTKTKLKTLERKGLIGSLVDKLLGNKKIPVTKTVYTDGITCHTQMLIEMIEDAKAEVQTDKTQELEGLT